jgi:hypothetical protein
MVAMPTRLWMWLTATILCCTSGLPRVKNVMLSSISDHFRSTSPKTLGGPAGHVNHTASWSSRRHRSVMVVPLRELLSIAGARVRKHPLTTPLGSSIVSLIGRGALLGRPMHAVEVVSSVNKRNVRERLWKVANKPLAARIVFFG